MATTRPWNSAITAALVVAALCGHARHDARVAHAQTSEDEATARNMFREARKLMRAGQFAEASEKLEAILELDVATGYVLNLAVCYEKLGKLASAWARYREAEKLATKRGQKRYARTQAKALAPRLPRLRINAPSLDGQEHIERVVTVKRAGQSVPSLLLGVSIPVDPGSYEIEASASGYHTFSTTAEAVEGQEVVVDIPQLEPEEVPEESTPTEDTEADARDMDDLPAPPRPRAGRGRRLTGALIAAAGGASILAGLGFGLSAKLTWEDAMDNGLCTRDTLLCSADGQAQTDRARTRGLAANILVGVGAAAVATGALLYLTAPRERDSDAVSVTPTVQPDALGLVVSGAF